MEEKIWCLATALGLDDSKCKVNTCDLIDLLEKKKEIDEKQARLKKQCPSNGHENLIQFTKDKNVPHAGPWIKAKQSQEKAGILFDDDN